VIADHALLPYGRQSVDDTDVAAVTKVLRSNWLTTGPMVEAFESDFCERVGAVGAAACANGTAALHLAALALDLEPGDHVVVPAITFLATANAARFVGAEVIFSDVDPDTGLMMPEHLEQALSEAGDRRIRAVFPVHLNGQCGDPEAIKSLADRHQLKVVEDACHALGTTYAASDGRHTVGASSLADLATFSFHPVKTIATGEGGMVTATDPELLQRVKRLRNHGMTREVAEFEPEGDAFEEGAVKPWYYEMQELGFNYRLDEMSCALGLSQLARLDSFVARRRELAELYRSRLAALAPILRPVPMQEGCEACLHLFVVLVDFDKAGISRAGLMNELMERGIGTQVHYIPINRQPYYTRRYGENRLPGAEDYYERCLSLPLFPDMNDSDVDRVVEALDDILIQRT